MAQKLVVDGSSIELFAFSETAERMLPVYFVIAAPQGQAGMVSQSLYNGSGFVGDDFKEPSSVRVISTCEHEVLPDHNAETVAGGVEFIVFVVSAAPDPEHIDICLGGTGKKIFVIGVSN